MIERARGAHRSALLVLVVAALPVVMAACDDTDDRRNRALQKVRGADPAAADRGAEELEQLLAKSPKDRASLYALAMHYQRRQRPIDAQHLLERIVDSAPNSEEAALAREQLSAMSRDRARGAASAQPSALPPLSPTAIVSGRGIGPAALGSAAASASAALGPCELVAPGPDGRVSCLYFTRGLAVASRDGVVVEVQALRDKRELFDSASIRHHYRGFVGETADGISVGIPEASASAKLGPPSSRRMPYADRIGEDGSIPVEVLDYPKKGISLEIDLTRGGRVVGAIGVPTLPGRPVPTSKDKP